MSFVLRFDNNVVEHLGLKLYQNKPTRVIAEVVSNSWDAHASCVAINMDMESENSRRWISVIDDGFGMNPEEIKTNYLVIGQDKRSNRGEANIAVGRTRRPMMGRKGIGKLAPFGIARIVDLLTSGTSGVVTWLRLRLSDVVSKGRQGEYSPELVFTGGLSELPVEADPTGRVEAWRNHISVSNSGTIVLMSDLSLKKAIPLKDLVESMGRRFTVTLNGGFSVLINGFPVDAEASLPKFEFRIPASGFITDRVGDDEVRYWVGFVRKADWPQDQSGVGVYAHGKIAQDRPFTFASKGNEIFSRYMYGVVEADWLDERDADLISTDRTSIDWESDEVQLLAQWGKKKVGEWTTAFANWRKTQEIEENANRLKNDESISRVTKEEQDKIIELVSKITPRMHNDDEAKGKLVRAVSDAWVQKPMRKLVQDLWTEIGSTDAPPQVFTGLVERLSAHRIPESLNLAVIFAQRAFAITKLTEYVLTGAEPNLQKLIERFPWIIEPDLAVLTANQTLKTVCTEAENKKFMITGRRRQNVGEVPDANKPDFIFLSSPEERDILVVELKSPQEEVTTDNLMQLQDYMGFLSEHFSDSSVRGILIGRSAYGRPGIMYPTTKSMAWSDVLRISRARNVELLAAMIASSIGGNPHDDRLRASLDLGGKDLDRVLKSFAEHDADLKILMEEFAR